MPSATYPDLNSVKTFLGIPLTTLTEDARLTSYLNAAIHFVEEMTGRSFSANDKETVSRFVFPWHISERGRLLYLGREFYELSAVRGSSTATEDLFDGMYVPYSFYDEPPYRFIRVLPKVTDTWNTIDVDQIWLTLRPGYQGMVPDDLFLAMQMMVEGMYRKRLSRLQGNQIARQNAAVAVASWVPAEAVGIISSYVRTR